MLPPFPAEPGVRKIAVLRANAIGDFVFSLPALDALRATYPDAEIVLLAQDWHAAFLKGRPGPVDRVVVVPKSRGVYEGLDGAAGEDAAALDAFFQRMAGEHFDLAVQLHGGGGYSNPFVSRLAARVTVGCRADDAPPLDRWIPYVYFQPEIARNLEVVALAGAPAVTLEPRIMVTRADVDESYRVVPETAEPLAILHPGAGARMRQWPAEKFAQVGDALAGAGARVVLTGGREEERDIVEAVAAAMRAPAAVTWGRLSLGGLVGLLSRCRVAVSNDSGPLHLAGAAGAPTVGIYWIGNLATASSLLRSRHRPVVGWQVLCSECGRHRAYDPCDHDVSFVAEVPVAEVVDAALALFGSR